MASEKYFHFHPRIVYANIATMTSDELINSLNNKVPPHTRINCLVVGRTPAENKLFEVVNVHLDLTGGHLIIEPWAGQ